VVADSGGYITLSETRAEESSMAQATANDLLDILKNHSLELLQQLELPVRQTQLSMPTDGKPRIKVSVAGGGSMNVPTTLAFRLRGRSVEVPLEVAEDLQHYSPF
jgi:hypothetical protein